MDLAIVAEVWCFFIFDTFIIIILFGGSTYMYNLWLLTLWPK